jgi:hypothetical protein
MDPQIESLKQFPCPFCGHSEYQFGQLVAPVIPRFAPGTEKHWNMPQHLWSVPKRIIARLCIHCRNIQSFECQFTAYSGESISR